MSMHDDRFDALSRQFWQDETRRRLLRRLAVLPVVGALGAFLARPEQLAAEHPVRHIQHRKEKRRQRKRRQLEHQRDLQRRDNGQGNDNLGASEECVPQDQICVPGIGTKCCSSMECRATIAGVPTCQLACTTTAECQQKLKMSDVECIADVAGCPSLTQCCRPSLCNGLSGGRCPNDGPCCRTLAQQYRCCAKGQHCAVGGGCAND
jgi:hypothetical protein